MKKVVVVGSGTMGIGIAQSCAQAGYSVIMTDIDPVTLTRAKETISWSLEKLETKDLLHEPKQDILSRIEESQDLGLGKDADLIIEAIVEKVETKIEIFKELEKICPEETILGTNTSSIPITDIAAAAQCPDRVIGIHFFNPVHKMKLVEIIRGLSTSDETVLAAKDFVLSLGKEPVMVNRDNAGFIVNKINGMAFLEALRLLDEGVANAEDIDKAMRLGLGHPMGPFELMDLVGLDVVLNARMGIYNETRNPAHYPPNILRRMVTAGKLGRKTKKGFYEYS